VTVIEPAQHQETIMQELTRPSLSHEGGQNNNLTNELKLSIIYQLQGKILRYYFGEWKGTRMGGVWTGF
jgi:hypothetical protein